MQTRCLQLETRLAEARDHLEEQKGATASMRRAAARAHGDAEAARKEVTLMTLLLAMQSSAVSLLGVVIVAGFGHGDFPELTILAM